MTGGGCWEILYLVRVANESIVVSVVEESAIVMSLIISSERFRALLLQLPNFTHRKRGGGMYSEKECSVRCLLLMELLQLSIHN